MENKKTMAWGAVILWCIFFFPVGFFLLYKKVTEDKSKTLKNGKNITNTSYVFIGIGIIELTSIEKYGTTGVILSVLFIGCGIWINFIGRKMIENGKRYNKYVSVILTQGLTKIDDITQAVGVTYSTAKIDLPKMIDFGYFEGASINEGNREIILPTDAFKLTQKMSIQTRKVICKVCGGNSTVTIGKINVCEYCGSAIE